MSETNVLRMENVTMQFGGVVAVNDLSLDVPEGQIVALIGPNGAGKTTAFNCITGVYQPTNGRVEFMGKIMIRNHPTGKMKKNYLGTNGEKYANERNIDPTPDHVVSLGIARTFQNIRLWKSMTVFENVLVAKHMRAKQNVFSAIFRANAKEEARMREETMELLKEQGLEQYKDEIATSLPYGLQRRLEIARALATDPKLLLLDEHTAALDPATAEKVLALTKSIVAEKKITCLMVTHNMHQALELGNRTLMMDAGRIVFDVKGAARSKMTVDDLLEKFRENAGKNLDNDRILLSKVEK